MLTLTNKHRIFLALQPIDFRKRLDGTLAVCRHQLQLQPNSGHVFIFRNKAMTTIRCVVYDNGGFWLMEKRLSKGAYLYWPRSPYDSCELTSTQLHQLLNNHRPLVNDVH